MLIQNEDIYCGVFDSGIIRKNEQRSHDREVTCYELELFHKDSGTSHINGTAYQIRRGMLLCSKPGQIRFSDFPLKCSFIRVFTKNLDEKLDMILASLPDVRYIDDEEQTERMLSLFSKLGSYFINPADTTAELRINSLFYELLTLIVRNENTSVSSKPDVTNAVRAAYEYINESFTKSCTLTEIADAVNLSPNHLHTVFREAIGMTPYEYVTEKRIEKAKKLIMSGDRSMLETALEVGFCSQSHFNKVFRKAVGMTPAEYRKNLLSQY